MVGLVQLLYDIKPVPKKNFFEIRYKIRGFQRFWPAVPESRPPLE